MYLGGTLACLDWLLRSMTPLAIDRNRVTYAASQQSALPPSFSRGSGTREETAAEMLMQHRPPTSASDNKRFAAKWRHCQIWRVHLLADE